MEHEGLLSANIQVDDELEILTAYGVKIAAPLLKSFASPTPEGVWLRVIKVGDGVATIQQTTVEELKRAFAEALNQRSPINALGFRP